MRADLNAVDGFSPVLIGSSRVRGKAPIVGEGVANELYHNNFQEPEKFLVANGRKGIWKDPLMPGKYAFNTDAGKVNTVPTTNVILKWISGQSGVHKLDDNLKKISLITKDAFEPNLPLTVVFNIDYRKASSVIQRFGDIKMLIEQSLDPMVAGYFKNIGQTKTLLELVQVRSSIQGLASEAMREKKIILYLMIRKKRLMPLIKVIFI